MFRSFMAKTVISVAASAGILLFSPMTQHAMAVTPSASATALPATSIFIDAFTGYTYPDTAAGLSDCDTEGAYLVANSVDGDFVGYYCTVGDPDAGVYNLWVVEYAPHYCRTC
jgi:hypothetical protein